MLKLYGSSLENGIPLRLGPEEQGSGEVKWFFILGGHQENAQLLEVLLG